MSINTFDKGSNGLIVNNEVVLLIETKKVKNPPEWLFNNAKRFGIEKHNCSGILQNNPPDRDQHHICHAWAAYAQSGFTDASILVIDGMDHPLGNSIAIYKANGDTIEKVKTYPIKHSLGSLYSAGVSLCGWENTDWCGRLMGASAYATDINNVEPFLIVDPYTGDIIEENGYFYVTDLDKYDEQTGQGHKMNFAPTEYLNKIIAPREGDIPKFDFTCVNIAGTIQYLFEQSVQSLLNFMYNTLPSRNLIITGGCGLNCVMNGKVIRSGMWNDLFIPNMCEDQGNIIGRMVMELGQKVTKPYIYNNVTYPVPKDYRKKISKEELAERIHKGQIVAWFEGGSEYGPRALCHRSILAKPTFLWMSNRINEIKHREYWRPLAPVVLDTHFKTFFDVPGRIWYPHKVMLATEYIRPEWQRKLPAICAPDNSSRPQVLTNCPENHTLYSLMQDYDLPILVNTSMNDAGMPICEYPQDAIDFTSAYRDVLLVFVKNDTLYIKE